jgi:hypothetical protein
MPQFFSILAKVYKLQPVPLWYAGALGRNLSNLGEHTFRRLHTERFGHTAFITRIDGTPPGLPVPVQNCHCDNPAAGAACEIRPDPRDIPTRSLHRGMPECSLPAILQFRVTVDSECEPAMHASLRRFSPSRRSGDRYRDTPARRAASVLDPTGSTRLGSYHLAPARTPSSDDGGHLMSLSVCAIEPSPSIMSARSLQESIHYPAPRGRARGMSYMCMYVCVYACMHACMC